MMWCQRVRLQILLLFSLYPRQHLSRSSLTAGRGFSPLKGFMNEEQYNSVVTNMRLSVRGFPVHARGAPVAACCCMMV